MVQVLRDMLGWPAALSDEQGTDGDAANGRQIQGCALRPEKEELTSQLLVLQIVGFLTHSLR